MPCYLILGHGCNYHLPHTPGHGSVVIYSLAPWSLIFQSRAAYPSGHIFSCILTTSSGSIPGRGPIGLASFQARGAFHHKPSRRCPWGQFTGCGCEYLGDFRPEVTWSDLHLERCPWLLSWTRRWGQMGAAGPARRDGVPNLLRSRANRTCCRCGGGGCGKRQSRLTGHSTNGHRYCTALREGHGSHSDSGTCGQGH